jgi:AhpD family alkylhydroperoxidase
MTHPVYLVPAAREALQDYARAAHGLGVSTETLELVHLRASQINGCSVCVEMHSVGLKKQGSTDERVYAVAAWRDAPYFTDAERAALALAEAVTRVADRGEPVSDELWAEVSQHYDEQGVTALLVAITGVNVWNRLNAVTRQPADAWRP